MAKKLRPKLTKKKQHFEISSRQRMGHQHTIIAKICQWLPAAHSWVWTSSVITRSRTDPFENQAIEKIDAAMRRALKIALGVPQRTKNELVHVLSDTMPISFRAKQAALIYHDKILHFGPEHPLYESVKKLGNYPIMKPRSTRYKNKNKPNKIINKRKTWAAVMIDMRKQLHLELPDYDNPVIYLPQIDYLVNATFHIHALCDTKENLIKTGKLELEGKRIQDTFVTPELLNSNADSYFTDGSVCQESNQAGAAALWINNSVCALTPFGIQTKIATILFRPQYVNSLRLR